MDDENYLKTAGAAAPKYSWIRDRIEVFERLERLESRITLLEREAGK